MSRLRLRLELQRRAVIRSAGQGESERHASWLELFYDLAFVATIGMLGTELAKDFSLSSLGMFLLLFVPVWWCWVGQTFYLSRFDSDDIVHRVLPMAQIFIVVFMGVSVPQAMEGNIGPFFSGYALLRLMLVGQYLYVARQLPAARDLAQRYSTGFAIGAGLVLIGAWLPPMLFSVTLALLLVAFATDFYTPFSCPTLTIKLPPDYSHFPERFGLFTIIVLGEGILGALNGLRRETMPPEALASGVLGLLLFCTLWWIYFEGVKGAHVDAPKDVYGLRRLVFWLFAHLPLTLCVVLLAVGVKKVASLATGAQFKPESATAVAIAGAILFLLLHAIWYLGWNQALLRHAHRISRPHLIATALILPVVAFATKMPAWGLIGSLALISLIHVVLIVIERPELRALDEANERARQGLPHEFALFS